MKKTTWFTVIILLLIFLAGMSSAAAAETFKGYITGNICSAQSMICLPEHMANKDEHIVFITEDGKSVYELQGVDQNQLREQFTYQVLIEGQAKDKTIEIQKITRIGNTAAGKSWKGGKLVRPKSKSGGHEGHKH